MAHDPAISGLEKFRSGSGARIVFSGTNAVEPVYDGGSYECPLPGGSVDTCPDIILEAGAYSDSFTIPSHWETHTGSGLFSDDFYPPPDLVLIEAEVTFRLINGTDGCGAGEEDPFGCGAEIDAGESTITVDLDGEPPDWHPSGITGWSDSYDPGRDPAFSGGSWTQDGFALFAPPAPVYTDPDPLDPSLPYAPWLWRWRDIVGKTFSISASIPHVHFFGTDFGTSFTLTATPYRYITPPVTSPDGTVYWL